MPVSSLEDSIAVDRVYIAEVIIPPEKEEKIRKKHDCTGDDVREALIYGMDVVAEWVDDDIHGERVEAKAVFWNGRPFVAYLDPRNPNDPNEGTFVLRTAFVKS
ncbi:hypothetical protein ACFLIM_28570 [Nonomuraea sp. M3C6]|uniref:Uncharacterized protein n=1 Tax=Nonomuraea marmarensis TaxID=3351344 RepID=A0ABW7AL29_9ACTN